MEVFRAMKADATRHPVLGASRRTLGAKPGSPPDGDIPISCDGLVHPGTGGMSVAPKDPCYLPHHRRPQSLGGNGRDPVFKTQVEILPDSLTVIQDQPTHALVSPVKECQFDSYQAAIHQTQADWSVSHE